MVYYTNTNRSTNTNTDSNTNANTNTNTNTNYLCNTWGIVKLLWTLCCSCHTIYGFQYIAKSFIFSGLIHAFFGILGLLLFFAGIDNSLVCFGCSTSPYLVDFPRVSGFSVSINAYAFSLNYRAPFYTCLSSKSLPKLSPTPNKVILKRIHFLEPILYRF